MMPSSFSWLSTTLLLAATCGIANAHLDHTHEPVARRLAPRSDPISTWYHQRETQYHKLFRRDPLTDGQTYPEVGSSTWTAAYPVRTPDSSQMPQAWKDALAAAVAAGKIPGIPKTTIVTGQNPQYPSGVNPNGADVCSSTMKCRTGTADVIWDAPDGQVGVSFDDGPIPGSSDVLYDFLTANNIDSTHFFIGVNIVAAPKEFLRAYEMDADIAVHTWTHPYMTSLSNEDVVAQLGWTIQIIHDSSGGRVPRFWRPPFGDADRRVFALAREIFGLTTVIWNHDTEDWSMATTNLTLESVENSLNGWYAGAKSPGLIILEHELTNDTVKAFIDTAPKALAAGWEFVSIARLDGQDKPYSNVDGDNAPTVVSGAFAVNGSSSGSSPSSPSSSTASHSSSLSSNATSHTSSATAAPSSGSQSNVSNTSSASANAIPTLVALLGATLGAALFV